MKINIDNYIGEQYTSKKYGPYIISKYIGKDNSNNTIVEVTFLKSGMQTITRLYRALNGNVRDPNYGINLNKTYLSDNYGPYKVLEVIKGKTKVGTKAKIQFLYTNNIKEVQLFHAINGDICDELAPNRIPLDTTILDEYDKMIKFKRFSYAVWREMMRRCTNVNSDNYYAYGGSGVTVCEEWNDYNNFVTYLPYISQYEKWLRFPTLYQLDKDYLQQDIPHDKRIYSAQTCIFLYYMDNTNLAKIEYRRNNELKSEYFGVHQETNDTYSAQMLINGNHTYLGTFDDKIVAANVYNYWAEQCHNYELVPLLNNVPYISNQEFLKHNTNPIIVQRV